ncbi:CheR family methyltransferase [Salipiger mucosus]|uniref:Chemotaxis protein methyltransferase CheR n=1 Tax=Salipiger mucosus DSM 16094 TaxID=1123237 RepID=S9RWK3_9RHOB|nr:CheR family methyltransferase [Salipiger mucosus]EPX78394.1 Chemotaxis protein methyltransferase CheR [Salipiger mucosus DSM 16094]
MSHDDRPDESLISEAETASERTCIVGVGASAGGLEAIREMLSEADASSNFAYVVVQHLDPNHESLLAELLGRHTDLEVLQAAGGERIQRGRVYIIPPGHGLLVRDGELTLTDFEQPRGLRRPIDDFFESLAEDQGRFAACVILSGTGADGSAGLRAIKEHGGLCLVQDPDTAKYDGMPVSAQNTGMVDFVRRPSRIIESIHQYYARTVYRISDEKLARTIEDSVDDICAVLKKTVGHDFSGYKKSTLVRRIQRRIQVLDLRDAEDYLRRVRTDSDECEVLFRELLINVTRFFRDPEHFEALRREVVPDLVRDFEGEELRVWVPGCSSGEEAYTMAMIFAHELHEQRRSFKVQVFATDIDEQMLRIAREGVYPHAALADVPEELRDRYTIAREGSFQIPAQIRDMIRFSVHSVVRDPPFSNIDLLSCRNLLIYFGEKLQTQALPIFHYSLKPGGILFLGPSETVGRFDELFPPINQQARIFRRNNARTEYPLHLRTMPSNRLPSPRRSALGGGSREAARNTLENTDVAERVLQSYAPATLHLTPSGQILASTGRLGKYVELQPGQVEDQHVQSIARPGLREAVSALIRKAGRVSHKSVTRDLVAQSEFGRQQLDLVADPLPDGTLLLVFRDRDRFEAHDEDDVEEVEPSDSHVQSLEDELRSTRARLHTTVEELETANEELKSSNEEMMSMNEELQSTNEELATVNDELKTKVDELSVANADLSNFFASTTLPLVVVDAKGKIRNFTEAINSIYPLRKTDRGRPLAEVTSALNESREVIGAIEEVMATSELRNMRVTEIEGDRTWTLAITPYLSRDGSREGATLVFTELTRALYLQAELDRERERLQLALEVAEMGVWELDPSKGTLMLDSKGRELFEFAPDGAEPRVPDILATLCEGDRERLEAALQATSDGAPVDETFTLTERHNGRSLRFVGNQTDHGRETRFLGVVFDVTAEIEARRVREVMIREMNHRVKNFFSIISGMVRVAGRTSESVPDLVQGIESRVNALARSHDMTQRPAERGPVTMTDAVGAALEPYTDSAETEVEGPQVLIAAKDLTALSLLLHEWATNAAKYGVLGPVEGRLEVHWAYAQDGKVTLVWNEIYAEALGEVTQGKAGFGSTLVRLAATQLGGEVTVDSSVEQRTTRLTYDPREL